MSDLLDPSAPLVEGAALPDGIRVARAAAADPPRARHFGGFYGLEPLPEGPLLVVHGNCQAESLRLLLQQAEGAPCVSVRMPAVHELAADEVPLLQRLLARAQFVVTQPIADDYHGLPLGTSQVSAAAPHATTVVFPVFRYAGVHPWQIVHTDPEVGDPPVVPYHDARTIMAAAGQPSPETTEDGIRAVAHWSLDELSRREERAGAVPASDLVEPAGVEVTNTINHPGNPVLLGLSRRVEERLGWPVTATDPGRVLLNSVHTPVEARVLRALDLDEEGARDHWVVGGQPVDDADIVAAQRDWYAAHPHVVADLRHKAARQLELLGAE